jgi:hypothetical protein
MEEALIDQGLNVSTTWLDSATVWIFTWVWAVLTIVYLAIIVFMLIAYRKVFVKAWKPWRWIFIPFYNRYLMLKIAGRPGWRLRRILIPPVFGILMIIVMFDTAKRFWKHRAFGLWLWLVPIVFIPILAFDKSTTYTPKIV